MIRSLKMIGQVLVAVLAMGAVLASSAAAQFESESAPVTLTVSANQMQKFAPTAGGTAVECTTMSLDNSTQSVKATTTLEVFPTYSNCEKILGLPTSVNMNGCGYRFHSAVGSTTATSDVVCPAGKTIVINIGSGPFCQYTIGEANNQGLSVVHFDNIGAGATREVTVTPEVAGIHSTRTVSGFGCPSASANGTYEGDATITGEDANGKHVGIFMD
jgi:hypothetical protein